MKLTQEEHRENARDFLAMSSPAVEVGERIDRDQLSEQLQYTDADSEDVEAIAEAIEEFAAE